MRVLLVDLAKSFGGAEVRTLLQAEALQNHTETCAVAVLDGSELHRRLQARGIPCHPIRVGRGSPQMLLALYQLIRQHQYQVVDAHNVHSIFWAHIAALMAGAPGRVATIHSDYGREYPGIKGRLYEASLWLNRRWARAYITVTEALQTKHAPQIDSTLIYNAVEVPAEPLGKRTQTLFFSAEDFIITIVGRLVPVKGHQYLIEAFAQLRDMPHIKLLIVGDGALRTGLEAQVQQLGLSERVRFTGFRDDIPNILQAVDALCMASLSEAMPFVVLEAAAYARPLIVTRVGGLIGLLRDESTALMVPAQNPQALADAIRRLASDPHLAHQLGQNAYQMVKTSFSTDTMIQQVLAVYSRTLNP